MIIPEKSLNEAENTKHTHMSSSELIKMLSKKKRCISMHVVVQPPSCALSEAKSSVYIKESYYCCSLIAHLPASRMFPVNILLCTTAPWSPLPSVSWLPHYACSGWGHLYNIIYLGLMKSGLSWAQSSASVCECISVYACVEILRLFYGSVASIASG